jgi:hypothetical protein
MKLPQGIYAEVFSSVIRHARLGEIQEQNIRSSLLESGSKKWCTVLSINSILRAS